MAEFVIVFGPPGSGKSLNKSALKTHYRCDLVFDDVFDDHEIRQAKGRVLILSHTEEVKNPHDRRKLLTGCLRVPVWEAAIELEEKWVGPRRL